MNDRLMGSTSPKLNTGDINPFGTFNTFLESERRNLQRELLLPERAQDFVNQLTANYPDLLGRLANIVCGQRYDFEDGRRSGQRSATGRDYTERYNGGVKAQGNLLRFDVDVHSDTLINRGTAIEIHEPCLVFEEMPRTTIFRKKGVRLYESYVPLIRIDHIEPLDIPPLFQEMP